MADSQRKTANLLDILSPEQSRWSATKPDYGVYYVADFAGVAAANRYRLSTIAGKTYTISGSVDNNAITVQLSNFLDNTSYPVEGDIRLQGTFSRTFTAQGQTTLSIFAREANQSANITDLIVYEGTATKPYEEYGWQHSLRKLTTATDTFTTLPADLYADGNNATVGLVGNMSQTGTPSPSNPVEVNGVGVRTENWFDGTLLVGFYLDINTMYADNPNYRSFRIQGLPAGQYTVSWNIPVRLVRVYYDGVMYENAGEDLTSYTVTSSDGDIAFSFRDETSPDTPWRNSNTVMLNSGSTAKPYEPYGYKIPISSGGVTTNIYLGSTQTVRKVKKYVYTGTEDADTLRMNPSGFFGLTIEPIILDNMGYAISTHYQTAQVTNANMPDKTIKETTTVATQTGAAIIIKDTRYTTLADFKAYLAQQYANGTPVTVWYCLTTEETGTINEPLMKLVGGDSTVYADTLSNAASIPTTEGANSITVDTTVQPSEFTATYTGWHDASVKEWDGSQWG